MNAGITRQVAAHFASAQMYRTMSMHGTRELPGSTR